MKERLLYIDALRGFTMYLVCIGHFLNHSGYAQGNLTNFIYSFHMPLFMAISGFVTAYTVDSSVNLDEKISKKVQSFCLYCWKKFRTVLLPYLMWCLIAIPFFFKTYPYNVDVEKIFDTIFISYNGLWFFPCLFGLLVCFGLFVLLKKICIKDHLLFDLFLSVIPALFVVCIYLTPSFVKGNIELLFAFCYWCCYGKRRFVL